MDEGDVVPAADAAVVVSETDAAHSHSSGDEEEGWLARRPQRRRIDCGLSSASENPSLARGEQVDSDDDDALKDGAGPGDLYCENMDDEDEAWVYKHMRSGREELVRLRTQQGKSDAAAGDDDQAGDNENDVMDSTPPSGATKRMGEDANNENSNAASDQQGPTHPPPNPQLQQARLLRPRNSDAILSCPRCFNIVCMDCQQHDRYAHQYRAMFVMNIGVDWNKRMVYDDAVGGLKLDSVSGAGRGRGENDAPMRLDGVGAPLPDTIPHDAPDGKEKDELYYSVHCGYCRLELAALDMKDEVYYFFGCIASA